MKLIMLTILTFLILYSNINSQPNKEILSSNLITPNTIYLYNETTEKPSPKDRIKEEQILVYKDKIIIKIENPSWATYLDTNSMDPIIDIGANGLEIKPESEQDLQVGDIIAYQKIGTNNIIVHRIIEIGYDQYGWYAILKGDNNQLPDPNKVRFNEIRYVLIGIIY